MSFINYYLFKKSYLSDSRKKKSYITFHVKYYIQFALQFF